jgi:hypothetical protein
VASVPLWLQEHAISADVLQTNRVARFYLAQHTKTGENVPKRPQNIENDHKMYQIIIKYMYQMDIISMHESTFHCKAFQNISKLFSLV